MTLVQFLRLDYMMSSVKCVITMNEKIAGHITSCVLRSCILFQRILENKVFASNEKKHNEDISIF